MVGHGELRILQNNLHRSRERTDSILNHPDTMNYSVLLLQEQQWTEFTGTSPIHQAWTLFEPTLKDTRPRAAIYVNRGLSAAQVTLPMHDTVAVQVIMDDPKPTLIINIYKSAESTPGELRRCISAHIKLNDYGLVVIAGDFNLHHPLWNSEGYTIH